ncbi:unnamed protein product, partial [marine sediment metagenome]
MKNFGKLIGGFLTLLVLAAVVMAFQVAPEIGIGLAFALPVCPVGCASDLPDTLFDECAPEINGAQVAKIYITNIGN